MQNSGSKIYILLSVECDTTQDIDRLEQTIESLFALKGPFDIMIYYNSNNLSLQIPLMRLHCRSPPGIKIHPTHRPAKTDPFTDYQQFIHDTNARDSDWVIFVEQSAYLLPNAFSLLDRMTLEGAINGYIGSFFVSVEQKTKAMSYQECLTHLNNLTESTYEIDSGLTATGLRFCYLRDYFTQRRQKPIVSGWEDLDLLRFIESLPNTVAAVEMPLAFKILEPNKGTQNVEEARALFETLHQELGVLKVECDQLKAAQEEHDRLMTELEQQLKAKPATVTGLEQ
jgi:hypothetical protein